MKTLTAAQLWCLTHPSCGLIVAADIAQFEFDAAMADIDDECGGPDTHTTREFFESGAATLNSYYKE